ncbi:MAG: C1 family peptidase [Bacteroidia bacterium]|nr:C1 family peptidase [Bacteroidia bacterium]
MQGALLYLWQQSYLHSQVFRDKALFRELKPGFYQNEILKSIEEFEKSQKKEKPKKAFKVDFSGKDLPTDPKQYKTIWHNPPVSQGNTNTCWSFATTSFFESEVYRLTGKKVRLSEMYTVYWEYVERARLFVQTRGNIFIGEGSETNAIVKIWKKYGICPLEFYTCLKPNQKYYAHDKLFEEFKHYLNAVKAAGAWNEEQVVQTTRAILDYHMGPPPQNFIVEGKNYTPITYLKEYLKLNLEDYVDLMSLMEVPYWKQAEYDVPDNWWNSDIYYNVPLEDFMNAVKKAVRMGYTVAIGGDVSEPGIDGFAKVAIVPTFDIPSEYIDENARQLRFWNQSTTDDHAVHLVGYLEKEGKDWYLIKDSGASARNSVHEGYYFFHEDYIKLKIMTLTLHKDVVKDILQKFN